LNQASIFSSAFLAIGRHGFDSFLDGLYFFFSVGRTANDLFDDLALTQKCDKARKNGPFALPAPRKIHLFKKG